MGAPDIAIFAAIRTVRATEEGMEGGIPELFFRRRFDWKTLRKCIN